MAYGPGINKNPKQRLGQYEAKKEFWVVKETWYDNYINESVAPDRICVMDNLQEAIKVVQELNASEWRTRRTNKQLSYYNIWIRPKGEA